MHLQWSEKYTIESTGVHHIKYLAEICHGLDGIHNYIVNL